MLETPFELESDSSCIRTDVIFNDNLTVTDSGEPPLSNTVPIQIFVTDINNHRPLIKLRQGFEHRSLIGYRILESHWFIAPSVLKPLVSNTISVLPEGSSKGTIISNIEYFDRDPCSPNNLLTIEIMESEYSKYFSQGSTNHCLEPDLRQNAPSIPDLSIDGTTIIVNDESLDFENMNEKNFEIVLVVTDRGNPNPLSSNQTISLTVGDVNDENPTLRLFNIEKNVPENRPTGYQLVQFEVQDPDTTANLVTAIDCNCLKSSQIEKDNCEIFSIEDTVIVLSQVFKLMLLLFDRLSQSESLSKWLKSL